MERVRICQRKEKTITTGRVETASRWKWQRLEIVETSVHPLANGMSLLRLQNVSSAAILANASFEPSTPPHFLHLLNESMPALKAITAATETNCCCCFNSTGTRRRYPVPIEGDAGCECSPPACSCMQGRWWWRGRLGAGCERAVRVQTC